MFYFLEEDLKDLESRITKLRSELEITAKSIGQNGGGEGAWHDNFAFEEAHRQYALNAKRVSNLQEIREHAQLFDPDTDIGIVQLGKSVTIVEEGSGETQTFQIGSYMIVSNSRDAVSYAAPLAQLISGATIGEVREGVIGGSLKRYKVVKIE
ncbi:MAG: transcription elongation factor GreA, transcription elongation factor GreA [candidate division WWE3 bacterium CSP1-7]|uniref:Transcription elongation factor GreA, transcription elongation factor GreA n=1 Tax=candidate division WWE3 bacterium CSP1-7 TaxID=1576480 RepID=A0A0T5ZY67_UNCKA|nr:MAG: transcription elongation factor GreA, transcription elongation factor GreA [candidate division WWE3 bacterium CSP1-7]